MFYIAMKRALVVVDAADTDEVQPTEASREITHLAGELAAGVGAELYVLHVTTDEEYHDRLDSLKSVDELNLEYDVDTAVQGTQQFAANVANDVFADLDIDIDVHPVGRIGDVETKVLEVADESECDHLFIAGRRRSPAGKAIFGDTTQSLILNFEGPVTVKTA